MLSFIPIEISRTASSGTWSFNTDRISGADLRQIVVVATTATTTFDLSITDDKDNVVLDIDGITGSYGSDPDDLLYLPMRGVYTVAVANASVDEAFTGRLLLEA